MRLTGLQVVCTLPLVFATALYGLTHRANLREHEVRKTTILVSEQYLTMCRQYLSILAPAVLVWLQSKLPSSEVQRYEAYLLR